MCSIQTEEFSSSAEPLSTSLHLGCVKKSAGLEDNSALIYLSDILVNVRRSCMESSRSSSTFNWLEGSFLLSESKKNNRKLLGREGGEGIGPSALKPFVLEFFPQYKSSGWEV